MAGGGNPASTDPLERALQRARGILPDQGPIGVFIHHNTLHAFQHLPFHEGVQAGADQLGARPYLDLDQFQAHLASGRVSMADLDIEVRRRLGDVADGEVLPGVTRRRLWLTLLTAPVVEDAAGLAFGLETGTAEACGDPALFQACLDRIAGAPPLGPVAAPRHRRHRDALIALGQPDTDTPVHTELIRLASRFLDQGHASIPMPGRSAGFLRAVVAHYGAVAPPLACPGLTATARAWAASPDTAQTLARERLDALGVDEDQVEDVALASLLALPGWAGMFARLEAHPEEIAPETGRPALDEFLAVRLLVESHAVAHACAHAGLPVGWRALAGRIPPPAPRAPLLDAHVLWWIARDAGLDAAAVSALTAPDLVRLSAECGTCSTRVRLQVFQEAFERHYRDLVLDALAAARPRDSGTPVPSRAQFVFCIDEREESMRRAVEEQGAAYVTFGVAGFFGMAIDYQGLDDHEPAAHCPPVIVPAHEVHEHPVPEALHWDRIRRTRRDSLHRWERFVRATGRTALGGAWTSFLAGPVTGLTTVLRIAAPETARAMSRRIEEALAPPPTRLSAISEVLHEARLGRPLGFSVEEAADRVTTTLTNIGLTDRFAPVVVLLGHGSTSLNNPHESAHDCGACGGRRGGANARLFAAVANQAAVRDAVRQRGIDIPAGTWFVGGLHDTAHDGVTLYDGDQIPPDSQPALEEARRVLDAARAISAQERCRRFETTGLDISPADALAHVEARADALGQPRPEYGHCTNAMAVVGRRALTRRLHLDRRAFLVSYDPAGDTDDAVLERILAAVGPVGAGISLEYYFSTVDNETFGCGTKLPHNVTGLVGVMNGHLSDLRTGLPVQMVELHEPMRLLLVVEATETALLGIAARLPEVGQLVGNAWVQLVAVHPETGAMSVLLDGVFEPYRPARSVVPVVARSADWHRRSRAHLPPALVSATVANA